MIRSDRLALLQTPFPIVHWLILAALAGSIVLAYLFESDAAALQVLDAAQLRYLFTVLATTFSALASLCADLADPFRGSFQITPSTLQIESIRRFISDACVEDEAGAVGAAARGGRAAGMLEVS